MTGEQIFLDTVFIQALLNVRDQYHIKARTLLPRIQSAVEVWVTEAVLIEVGNALSAFNRTAAIRFIQHCYQTPNMCVVSVDTELLNRALQFYQSRLDKTWGLTDCISFIVMQNQGLINTLSKQVIGRFYWKQKLELSSLDWINQESHGFKPWECQNRLFLKNLGTYQLATRFFDR